MTDLFKNIDSITGAIDEIYSQMARAREDALNAIRNLLKSIKGNVIWANNVEDALPIAYEGRHGDIWHSNLRKLYYDPEKELPLSKGIFFELDDGTTLSALEVISLDIFETFDLIFKMERQKKIDYINGVVSGVKPYALRLNAKIEIAYTEQIKPDVVKPCFKNIDHIALTEFEEDGAKAFTDFTNGVYINELPLYKLAEIEAELAKGAYMVR
jgi:hypothetical protein